MPIKKNLNQIKAAITAAEKKYSREKSSVVLVAVSKSQNTGKIKEAIDCGQIHFGENYLQEALPKIAEIANHNIIWHYIGKIQSKKAKLIAQNFSWVETVASYEIAKLLDKYRPTNLPPLNICIQINISNEATKSGIMCEKVFSLAKKIMQLPNLRLRGLMAIPRYFKEFDQQLKVFNDVYLEFENLKNYNINVDTLSIGMSEDFVAAIAAGTTMVRIGTAIFGERSKKFN